ncbi:MAG: hypothetical protein GY896_23060 [Gammaproteobacteria bacterium]|nr:hypothetical protein [Gammaproteobacteria bacterium]
MAEIVAFFKLASGAPLVAPVDLPEVTVRRIDTQAIVAGPSAMTEIGEGLFSFLFSPSPTLEYTISADGDPNVTSQVPAVERYKGGAISGTNEAQLARLDVDVSSRATPADVSASEAVITAAIAALNDLSIADVQTALTTQGYTTVRAALLDNLDVPVSSVGGDCLTLAQWLSLDQ